MDMIAMSHANCSLLKYPWQEDEASLELLAVLEGSPALAAHTYVYDFQNIKTETEGSCGYHHRRVTMPPAATLW